MQRLLSGLRSFRDLLLPLLLAVVLAAIGAALLSKWYWGYFILRPSLAAPIRNVAKIHGLMFFRCNQKVEPPTPRFLFEPYDHATTAQRVENARSNREYHGLSRDPYYFLEERVLFSWRQRGLLPPASAEITHANQDALYGLLKPYANVDYPWRPNGLMAEAASQTGEELLVVSLRSPDPTMGDHWVYHELLFARNNTSANYRCVARTRFSFDVAGLEGLEWPALVLVLLLFLAPSTYAVFLLMALLRRRPLPRE